MTITAFHSAPIRSARTLATIVAVSLGMSAIAADAGLASAAPAPTHTDEITFDSHVHLGAQRDGVSNWTLVADSCMLVADGATATPCQFTGNGTLGATGGTARGRITGNGRVIRLDETFALTGPSTAIGWGPATITGGGGAPSAGSFTGSFEFSPTAKPNVLLNRGTITVTH